MLHAEKIADTHLTGGIRLVADNPAGRWDDTNVILRIMSGQKNDAFVIVVSRWDPT